MLSLSGHIGTKASALVDGQLPPAEAERAWSHVLTCPGCRRLVEHEGMLKRRLGGLSAPESVDPPPQLLGSLYAVDAWAAVDAIESSRGVVVRRPCSWAAERSVPASSDWSPSRVARWVAGRPGASVAGDDPW